jgi:hypothetical protein
VGLFITLALVMYFSRRIKWDRGENATIPEVRRGSGV